jgi:glycosyltransferase involved in cell wall biosynthesis
MNVLFSNGDYYPNLGGATSLIDDLAVILLRAGHSAAVLTRRHPGTALSETYHGYDILRIDYPMLYEKFVWKTQVWTETPSVLRRIAGILRERSISTVCIGLLDMSAWYLLLLRPVFGFRLVLYLHGDDARGLPATEPSYATLLRMALRAADEVIAISDELKAEAAAYWPGALSKTQVIRNAIDISSIRNTAAMVHPRRYIAAVGRLVPEKDFGTLVRAYAKVQEQIGDVDLIVAGEGKKYAELRQAAALCPRPDGVILKGRVERDVSLSVMKGALFVAMPSVSEGFPIVAVEALALGKPILGSSIPGIAALVADGRLGDLFAPGDVDALSSLIRGYCCDAEVLRERTREAETMDFAPYDIAQVAARHLDVYRGNG